jgi:uncharacterized membrane protein
MPTFAENFIRAVFTIHATVAYPYPGNAQISALVVVSFIQTAEIKTYNKET